MASIDLSSTDVKFPESSLELAEPDVEPDACSPHVYCMQTCVSCQFCGSTCFLSSCQSCGTFG